MERETMSPRVKKWGSNAILMGFLVTIATGVGSLVSSYAFQVPRIVTKLESIELVSLETQKELKRNTQAQISIMLSVEKINGRVNMVENNCDENTKQIEACRRDRK